ncbi:MAG: efflux RND transporter periplasmic adaptor subunit [Gammaproteobacteria bacterium]|jgi:HlyD family secretion protein|nr:efflux RND transporter periplasmic adaptor subunit [Gammaproteobacteria bacterium]
MKVRLFIGLLILAIIAGVVYWWQVNNSESAPSDVLVLYGNVDIRESRLAFNGSEHVVEILVDEGDQVQKGQLLARLHTDRLQAALARAKAEVVAAKAEAHAAQLSYARIKSLLKDNLASPKDADEAEARSRAAAANVDAARAAVVETTEELKDTDLYAPFNGVVRERIVEIGDFVTPQNPAITLASLSPVWVRTYLPETELGRIKPGAIAHITTDSYPGKVYDGWVGSVSPTAEFTPKNIETPELRTRLVYQARVFICNPQNELRLGMPATVSIPLNQTIPSAQPRDPCTQADTQQK